MTKEYNNVLDAKRSLKAHIQFMETLLKGLNETDKTIRERSLVAAWCLHNYFSFNFMNDIQAAHNKEVENV